MKWFQQNRALGTLLIVFGTCALFTRIILYWRWATWRDARQTFDKAAAERSRLDHLDPFPNDANYRKLQSYLDRYSTALNKFKDELKNGVVPAPPLAPNEFQSRLRQVTVATLSRAQTNNVKLPDKFGLGFDEFATTLPDTAVTPLLGQELSQIQMLVDNSTGRQGGQRNLPSSRPVAQRTQVFVDSDAISSRQANRHSSQNKHAAINIATAKRCRSDF